MNPLACSLDELVKYYKEAKDPYVKISQSLACTITDIIDAFIDLLSNERLSVDKITVKMLASRAGYSRTTFDEHFCDVYDVQHTLEEMLLYHFDLNAETYSLLFNNKLPTEAVNAVSHMLNHYGRYVKLLLARDQSFAGDYKEKFISTIARSMPANGSEGVRRLLAGRVCAAAMIEGYMFWLEHQDELPYAVVRETSSHILSGIYY